MKNLTNTTIQAKLSDWQYLLEQNKYRVDMRINTDLSDSDFFNKSFTVSLADENSTETILHSNDQGSNIFLIYNVDENGVGVMEITVPDTSATYQVKIRARLVIDTGTTEEVEFPYLDVDGNLQTDRRIERVYETDIISSNTLNLETNSWV